VKELGANWDLVAITVLAAVLGVSQAPPLAVKESTIRMERTAPKLRIQKLHPSVHTIPYLR
jgi:hypothetical protein